MFSVTTNTYIFFVNYENSCKGKIKSAYMQIFFHFFLILCAFFLFTIFEGLRARACVLLIVGSHPHQNGLVAMNVALRH